MENIFALTDPNRLLKTYSKKSELYDNMFLFPFLMNNLVFLALLDKFTKSMEGHHCILGIYLFGSTVPTGFHFVYWKGNMSFSTEKRMFQRKDLQDNMVM